MGLNHHHCNLKASTNVQALLFKALFNLTKYKILKTIQYLIVWMMYTYCINPHHSPLSIWRVRPTFYILPQGLLNRS